MMEKCDAQNVDNLKAAQFIDQCKDVYNQIDTALATYKTAKKVLEKCTIQLKDMRSFVADADMI